MPASDEPDSHPLFLERTVFIAGTGAPYEVTPPRSCARPPSVSEVDWPVSVRGSNKDSWRSRRVSGEDSLGGPLTALPRILGCVRVECAIQVILRVYCRPPLGNLLELLEIPAAHEVLLCRRG